MFYTVPGPPSVVVGLCTVVMWGQQSHPSGEIVKFEVQLSIPGVWYGTIHHKRWDDVFHIVQESDTPSDYLKLDSEFFVGVSEPHNVISMDM